MVIQKDLFLNGSITYRNLSILKQIDHLGLHVVIIIFQSKYLIKGLCTTVALLHICPLLALLYLLPSIRLITSLLFAFKQYIIDLLYLFLSIDCSCMYFLFSIYCSLLYFAYQFRLDHTFLDLFFVQFCLQFFVTLSFTYLFFCICVVRA